MTDLPVRWTVLVYASAANDLAGSVEGALHELVETGPPENVDVLVRHIDGEGLAHDFRVTKGKAEPLPGGLDGAPRNGADPETLRSFLDLGIQAYPSQRVALVVNGHGEGHRGVAMDFRHDARMSIPDFEKALQPHPVDAVIFEACLMGSAEVACALQGEARAIIASEDVVRAGRLYPRILSAVSQARDGESLGRALVADASTEMTSSYRSLACATTNQAPRLEASLSTLSKEVLAADDETIALLRQVAEPCRRAKEVTGNILMGYFEYDGPRIDLADFTSRVAASDAIHRRHPALTDAAHATHRSLQAMLVAQRGAGLSLHLPRAYDPSHNEEPSALAATTGWDQAARRIALADAEAAKPPSWGDLMQLQMGVAQRSQE